MRCEDLPAVSPIAEISDVREQIIHDETINERIELNMGKQPWERG